MYVYNFFKYLFSEYPCIFPACFLCNVRVSCTLTAYLLVKEYCIRFLYCLYFSAIFLAWAASSQLKNFRSWKRNVVVPRFSKHFKICNAAFSYRYQCTIDIRYFSLWKEKATIFMNPCIQTFKLFPFLYSTHTVNLNLSPDK